MSRICEICGKRPTAGRSITRRGKAKKDGGVGKKTTGIASRIFRPNLQRIKGILNGSRRTLLVCTCCIQAGKVQKSLPSAYKKPTTIPAV